MPIYEYRCSACGHELEVLQKFADPPLVTCAKCSHATLIKLMSASGFQLKGSGWYQTDFKGSGAKPAPNGDSDTAKRDAATNGSTAGDASKGDTAGDAGKSDSSKSDGAKSDGAKSDGAKSDGAKGDGAKAGGKATDTATKTVKPSAPTGASRSSP